MEAISLNLRTTVPTAKQGAHAAFAKGRFPKVLSDLERRQVQTALNTVLASPRLRGLLSSKAAHIGGNVSVTTTHCTVYEVLSLYKNKNAPIDGTSPEQALRSLVGTGREHGELQLAFEMMLASSAHRVISAMQEVQIDLRKTRNPELCRQDF